MSRIPAICCLACMTLVTPAANASDVELREHTDPITGEESVFEVHSIGEWEIYTYQGITDRFLMVGKAGKPVVAVEDAKRRSISIFSGDVKLALTVIDHDANGQYDWLDYAGDGFLASDYGFDGWLDTHGTHGTNEGIRVWVEGAWHDLISQNGGREKFIEVDDKRLRIELVDGRWQVRK